MNGLLTQVSQWLKHPMNSGGTVADWFAGLILVLILAFLWKTVVDKIEE